MSLMPWKAAHTKAQKWITSDSLRPCLTKYSGENHMENPKRMNEHRGCNQRGPEKTKVQAVSGKTPSARETQALHNWW
jgi:hypothetical protein